MADLSTMVIASLSKIWHLIPIVIAIILFKKFINNKDKKNRIKKNEENEKNGLTLELRVKKKYEDLAYKVTSNEIKNDQSNNQIDFLCYKDNRTLLFTCNNSSTSKSITQEDIKEFINNANKYVETNNMEENKVEFRYAISYIDVLDKTATKILIDDKYNCKYVVI